MRVYLLLLLVFIQLTPSLAGIISRSQKSRFSTSKSTKPFWSGKYYLHRTRQNHHAYPGILAALQPSGQTEIMQAARMNNNLDETMAREAEHFRGTNAPELLSLKIASEYYVDDENSYSDEIHSPVVEIENSDYTDAFDDVDVLIKLFSALSLNENNLQDDDLDELIEKFELLSLTDKKVHESQLNLQDERNIVDHQPESNVKGPEKPTVSDSLTAAHVEVISNVVVNSLENIDSSKEENCSISRRTLLIISASIFTIILLVFFLHHLRRQQRYRAESSRSTPLFPTRLLEPAAFLPPTLPPPAIQSNGNWPGKIRIAPNKFYFLSDAKN